MLDAGHFLLRSVTELLGGGFVLKSVPGRVALINSKYTMGPGRVDYAVPDCQKLPEAENNDEPWCG